MFSLCVGVKDHTALVSIILLKVTLAWQNFETVLGTVCIATVAT